MIPSIFKTVKVFKETKEKRISLVQRKTDDQFMVERRLKQGDYFIYKDLMNKKILGIPKIYDVFIEDGWLIVLEEYVEATTLDKLIPLAFKQAVDVMCQLCDILTILHKHDPPIIHRDIKPENIFIKDGKVILFDFDIARYYDPSKQKDTTVLGSVGYAAPEQFGFLQTSIQSDIYSCGKLLQVMLSGSLDGEIKWPYKSIINKALNMDPKNRFKNTQELKDALQFKRYIIPGINNPSLKGKIGSWILWILNGLLVFDIDVGNNTTFKSDFLYLCSCFVVIGLVEILFCNRNTLFVNRPKILRCLLFICAYFVLLVIILFLLLIIDQMMPSA